MRRELHDLHRGAQCGSEVSTSHVMAKQVSYRVSIVDGSTRFGIGLVATGGEYYSVNRVAI